MQRCVYVQDGKSSTFLKDIFQNVPRFPNGEIAQLPPISPRDEFFPMKIALSVQKMISCESKDSRTSYLMY